MFASFTRQAARGSAVLRRALTWPARVASARRTMTQLAGMSDHQLRDIGLSRQDVFDATALPLDADVTPMLERRRAARIRSRPRPATDRAA